MKNIKKSVVELVGNTPLVELTNYEKKHNLKAKIIGKLEFLNPSGSVKDRAALAMIEDAEEKGILKKGSTIIDATSGNTGISLATIAAAKEMKFEPYLEDGVTIERRQIFNAFGLKQHEFDEVPGINVAEGLVLDDLVAGMYKIAEENDFYYTNQTMSEVNQEAHYKTTGPEIWRDTDGDVDIFVATGGTAGTIVGVGRYLREKNPNVKIVGVQAHPHSRPEDENFNGNLIDGILPLGRVDEKLVPPLILKNLDNGFEMDEIIDILTEDAYETARELTQTDGIFLGTSAAAALTAAKILAERPENEGKNIVVIFADNGMKYLSTNMYK